MTGAALFNEPCRRSVCQLARSLCDLFNLFTWLYREHIFLEKQDVRVCAGKSLGKCTTLYFRVQRGDATKCRICMLFKQTHKFHIFHMSTAWKSINIFQTNYCEYNIFSIYARCLPAPHRIIGQALLTHGRLRGFNLITEQKRIIWFSTRIINFYWMNITRASTQKPTYTQTYPNFLACCCSWRSARAIN